MKLIDMNPIWYAVEGRHGQGIIFKCPLHENCYIGVSFKNPLDGGEPYIYKRIDGSISPLWDRIGDTFETLTLTPSIVSQDDFGKPTQKNHWHGYITNGEIITC